MRGSEHTDRPKNDPVHDERNGEFNEEMWTKKEAVHKKPSLPVLDRENGRFRCTEGLEKTRSQEEMCFTFAVPNYPVIKGVREFWHTFLKYIRMKTKPWRSEIRGRESGVKCLLLT